MKRSIYNLRNWVRAAGISAAGLVLFFTACEVLGSEEDEAVLRLSLGGGVFDRVFGGVPYSKAGNGAAAPDSSLYILDLTSADGVPVYNGLYGEAPQSFSVKPGAYSVSVRSADVQMPAFDQPIFGDDQVVHIASGQTMNIRLECTMLNCGIRLLPDQSFIDNNRTASLSLRHKDGSLDWEFGRDGIAFFNPGEISLLLSRGGEDKLLSTKTLEAREILRLKIFEGESAGKPGISITTDTTAHWLDDTIITGGTGGVLDVGTARGMEGTEGVWVYGYIAGNASPFLATSSATNLAISGKTKPQVKDECMSVELKKGALRDALNLVSNPSLVGKKIFLKGDIVKYYNMPGVKNITDWTFDESQTGL